jgi:circadian clock protein KaiC
MPKKTRRVSKKRGSRVSRPKKKIHMKPNISHKIKRKRKPRISKSLKTAIKKPHVPKKSRKKSPVKIKPKAHKHPIKKVKAKILKSLRKKPKKLHRKHIPRKPIKREFVKTNIKGLDDLFEKGIPKGASVLLAGGAGSGKTIMGLQILRNAAKQGKKCLYMSFEESENSLHAHMEDFGWKPEELKNNLRIKRFSVFDISRSLDALMAKSEGELLIDVKPIILPEGFSPDFIIVDSLTAIASAFKGSDTYRSYIEHLFRYFEKLKATSFMITETEQVPKIFSPTGVEEFLADGVIVLYNVRKGDIRENAIEILKMRGAKHIKKVVAMQILSKIGVEIYPEQEVFGGIK